MSEYKRFISYIYAYDRGIKSKNVGFAKMEVRNGECRITISIKGAFAASGKELIAYLFYRQQEKMLGVRIGSFLVKNGMGEFYGVTAAENICGSNRALEEMNGIVLCHSDETARMYASGWDDHAMLLENFVPMENRMSGDMTTEQNVEQEHAAAAEQNEEQEHAATVEQNEEREYAAAAEQAVEIGNVVVENPVIENPAIEEPEVTAEEALTAETRTIVAEKAIAAAEVTETEIKTIPVMEAVEEELARLSASISDAQSELEAITPESMQIPQLESVFEMEPQPELTPITEPVIQPTVTPEMQPEPAAPELEPITPASEPVIPVQEPVTSTQQPEIRAEEQELNQGQLYQPQAVHNALWCRLENTFPKVIAFEDDPDVPCLKIDLKDLECLPRENWGLANNSFLLHGYYNFRYLILAKMGENQYMIGVPGMFHNNERFMAAMFGFEHFKPVKECRPLTGQFGYWYQWVVM